MVTRRRLTVQKTVEDFKVPYMDFCMKTADTLKWLYQQQKAAVRVDSELTNWFDISTGARQGCLVTLLFNCYTLSKLCVNLMMYSVELALLLTRGGSRVTVGAAPVKFLTPCGPKPVQDKAATW